MNNIAAATGTGSICHYNGKDWKEYYFGEIMFFSICVKEDLIAATGLKGNKAVLVLGKRI